MFFFLILNWYIGKEKTRLKDEKSGFLNLIKEHLTKTKVCDVNTKKLRQVKPVIE